MTASHNFCRTWAAAALLAAATAQAGVVVGGNVNISKANGYEGETAVAIDPTNPNRLFAFSNQQQSGNPGLFGAYSTDGGTNWTTRYMATGADITNSCCDPSAQFDRFGNLFITYLSSSINVVVAASTNGGASFATLANLGGGDQPTLVTGAGNVAGHSSTWVSYNNGGSMAIQGMDVTGLGTWGAFGAAQVAPSSAGGSFGDIAVGANGQVLVAYQAPSNNIGPSTIYTNLDSDGLGAGGLGARMLASTTNVGGFAPITPQPSRTIDAEASLAYDTSGGPHNGRLYMVYTDRANTATSDTDIYLRYSDNDGVTWSTRVKVNDDGGTKAQFFPKLTVDPVTGHVAIVWYDARNDAAGRSVQLFGTLSVDGGLSLLANELISAGLSNSALVANGNEFGDYIGLTGFNDVFYPVWTDNSNSTGDNPNNRSNFDMYTARITYTATSGDVPEPGSLALTAMAAGLLWRQRRRGRTR